MFQTYCQWQNHEEYIDMKNYQKEVPEKVKDFCKEIPAFIYYTHEQTCNTNKVGYT